MAESSKKIKVLIGKAAIDGHWRGLQAVATALRDAGMEVVYVGVVSADEALQISIQEQSDVIGLNVGASYRQIEELIRLLHENEMEDILVITGGVIPRLDIPKLKDMGVHGVFPPGTKLVDIVSFIKDNCRVTGKDPS